MNHPRTLAWLLKSAAVLTLVTASTALGAVQLSAGELASEAALDPHSILGADPGLLIDEPGDGRSWARGPQWKASFGPEGMTYIPFFGSDAPQNYPIQFDLSRVTVAGDELALGERIRSRTGRSVELHRGSVAEIYHLNEDTVEQTFVFDSVLPSGDLVLEIDVKTELAMAPTDQGGMSFSSHLGSVSYGRALAVDAHGKTLELREELTESGFQIVVPAEYVATAQLPLVVDPILSTFSVATNSRRQLDVDVAYEHNGATFQIVYSEVQSATDFDVIAVRYSSPLGVVLSPASIDITSSLWNLPVNASSYHEGQFLCASIVGVATGSRRVWGRTMDSSTGARGSQFQISGPGAEFVDVGGKGNDINSSYDYMVVWQEADSINQDFDIVAQAVSGNSLLTAGRIVIDGDSDDLDRRPSISKSSGLVSESNANNEYMIVWEREISPTNRNLRAQVIEYTGSMAGHSQFNAYTFSDSRSPDVSSRSTQQSYSLAPHWTIVFERLVGSEYKIFGVVARDGFADNARNIHTMQNLDVDGDHREPVIAWDGQDLHIAYQTEALNGDRALNITSANVVHDDGELRLGLGLRRETLALSRGAPGHIGMASRRAGGALPPPMNGDVVVAWSATESVSGDSDVTAAVFEDNEGLTLGAQYCAAALNSTGTSGWMAVRGSNWNPQIDFTLEATDLPLQSFGHFIVSRTSGFVVNPGGSQGNLCLQGAVGRFNRPGEILNSGTSGAFALGVQPDSIPSPSGSVTIQPGETWFFQCWFRDVGPSSNFTNAVEVVFD